MPTNHDETLAERYMRELQTELAIYSRMTPEQIGAMAVDLHNALAERDAALAELATVKKVAYGNLELLDETELLKAELAALKGGQEAVAWAVCREPGKVDALSAAYASESAAKAHVNSYATKGCSGLHVTPLYPAPPAQASEWVPVSESLPADRRDVMLYCADTKEHFVGFSKGGGLFQFAQDGNGLSIVCRPSHWRYIEDSDAPTPGASDGKGGDV